MQGDGAAATLRQAMDRLTDEHPQLDDLVSQLGDRAPGFLLMALAIPALVPTPGLPAGFLFGTLLALVAAQLVVGRESLTIPGWIGRRRIRRTILHTMVTKAAPVIERIERRLRARQSALAHHRMLRPVGAVVVAMGFLIALPIPFGNTLPALAVLVLAMGLLARDGLAVAAGLGLSAVATGVSVALIAGTVKFAGTALV